MPSESMLRLDAFDNFQVAHDFEMHLEMSQSQKRIRVGKNVFIHKALKLQGDDSDNKGGEDYT